MKWVETIVNHVTTFTFVCTRRDNHEPELIQLLREVSIFDQTQTLFEVIF